MPDPHDYWTKDMRVHSYRRHAKAHHRVEVKFDERQKYKEYQVMIPKTQRRVPTHKTHVRQQGYDPTHYVFVHNFRPETQVDRMMNRRMHDRKHRTRSEQDDSRHGALNKLRPSMYKYLKGAIDTGDAGVIADTALVLNDMEET